jgi:hypothetical protein
MAPKAPLECGSLFPAFSSAGSLVRPALFKPLDVLHETEQLPLPQIWPRAVELPRSAGKITVLTGIRCSGKTFILLDLIRCPLADGVRHEDLGYLPAPEESDLVEGIDHPEAWVNTSWSLSDEETWRREIACLQRAEGP